MASRINDYIEEFFKCFEKEGCGNILISYENNNCFKYFFEIKECEDNILGVHYLVPAFLFSEVKTMLSPCCQNSGTEFYLKWKYFELHLRNYT